MSGANPTVVVTGAAGYIGSRVTALLAEARPDWDIAAIDDFSTGNVRTIGGVSVRDVDITDREALAEQLAGADAVLHLAAVSGVEGCRADPDRAYEVNVTGTNNVAWWCRRSSTPLAFASSMAVLGDPSVFPLTPDAERAPLNWYGRTKLLGERALPVFAADAFPAHAFLKANLYGEHAVDGRRVSKDTVITLFVEAALAGEPLTVYEPGTQARNYVHVDDVARAYVRSADRLLAQDERGETGVEWYTLGTEEDPSVQSLAELVVRLAVEELDREVPIERVENPREETLVSEFAVDTSAARERLDWTPERTVEETIRERLRRARED